MTTRIDLEGNVKEHIRRGETLLWCGSTAGEAKPKELERDHSTGFTVMLFLFVMGTAGMIYSMMTGKFFWGIFEFALFGAAGYAVYRLRSLGMKGGNYALTDRRIMQVSDGGNILAEYCFDKPHNIFMDVSDRGIGYIMIERSNFGRKGPNTRYFTVRGIYDTEEVYELVRKVDRELKKENVKSEKAAAKGGWVDYDDAFDALDRKTPEEHAADAEKKTEKPVRRPADDGLKPLRIDQGAVDRVSEVMEYGEKLLWCEELNLSSYKGSKGGCLLSFAGAVGIFELVIRLIGWGSGYSKETIRLTSMLCLPGYIIAGLFVLPVIIKPSASMICAVTDKRIIEIRKKKVMYAGLADITDNGVQVIQQPGSCIGDLRLRAHWTKYGGESSAERAGVWSRVYDAAAVACLIEDAREKC